MRPRPLFLSILLTSSLAVCMILGLIFNKPLESSEVLSGSLTTSDASLPIREIADLSITGNGVQVKRAFRWTGTWMPMRLSAVDGITALDTKIGSFIHFPDKQAYLTAIQNVNRKFPGSLPWSTWTVGDLSRAIPSGIPLSDAQHEDYLSLIDQTDIRVFLEIFPFSADSRGNLPEVDAATEIDRWLNKFKHHKSIAGVGIELEYFGKATDSLAIVWNNIIKHHNPRYRMFLRHYNQDFMPPTYRGDGDLIFICDASESTIPQLNKGFANWANHFAPTACAFQIGYPADEDDMAGSKTGGWWRLKDPVRVWGNEILTLIKSDQQEIGLIWVTAKSGKSYNKDWDLTR